MTLDVGQARHKLGTPARPASPPPLMVVMPAQPPNGVPAGLTPLQIPEHSSVHMQPSSLGTPAEISAATDFISPGDYCRKA